MILDCNARLDKLFAKFDQLTPKELTYNQQKKATSPKYQQQYHNLKIIYNEDYHDRYFILDREILYHCGTSINYAGAKVFSISEFEDSDTKTVFINKIIKIIEESPQN